MRDDEPNIRSTPKLDLELLSEDELETRIVTLKEDIAACQAELERKRAHRSAANALFGNN